MKKLFRYIRVDRKSPGDALTLRWGLANYVRMGNEKACPRVIGFTNHIRIGNLNIHFYHFPLLLRLYRHLKALDERHQ